MGKITIIKVLSVVMLAATTAWALNVAVGASYAPALMARGASTSDQVSFLGIRARATFGTGEGLSWALGAGYTDYVCRGELLIRPYVVGFGVVESIDMAVFTFGANYGLAAKGWLFNVEAGAAGATEFIPIYYNGSRYETLVEFAPGLYAGAGASRPLGSSKWALAFGPRVTFLFDDPVGSYQITGIPLKADYRRAGRSSVLVDFMIGFDYNL